MSGTTDRSFRSTALTDAGSRRSYGLVNYRPTYRLWRSAVCYSLVPSLGACPDASDVMRTVFADEHCSLSSVLWQSPQQLLLASRVTTLLPANELTIVVMFLVPVDESRHVLGIVIIHTHTHGTGTQVCFTLAQRTIVSAASSINVKAIIS